MNLKEPKEKPTSNQHESAAPEQSETAEEVERVGGRRALDFETCVLIWRSQQAHRLSGLGSWAPNLRGNKPESSLFSA